MEKLNKVNSGHFRGATLYLEDVKAIVYLLTISRIPFSIETDSYAYQDFSEFRENELNRRSSELEICTKRIKLEKEEESLTPEEKEKLKTELLRAIYFSVRYSSEGCFVYISGNDLESTGLFNEISSIIKKRVPRIHVPFSTSSRWTAFIVLILLLLAPYTRLPYNETIITIITKWALVVFLLANSLIERLKKDYIVIKELSSNRNFFIRRKDDIILALISGLLGAVVGALVTSLLE